jgi:hypothetical protein
MMRNALRSGISVTEFWQLTPRETWAAIDAAVWREQQQEEHDMAMAWLMAKLSRAKKIPSLKSLLSKGQAPRPLRGAEKTERRAQFKKLAAPDKVAAINAHAQKLHAAGKIKDPAK